MKDARILIVEDNFFTRNYLVKQLKGMGFPNTIGVSNIDDALYLLQSQPIDLCILDIHLGKNEKEGLWLGEYLANELKIPFLYLTAYDTESAITKALTTTPYAYLTKPVNLSTLYATVKIILAQNNRRKKIKSNQHLIFRNKKGYLIKVRLNDILFVKAEKNYLKFQTFISHYYMRSTLKNILRILPKNFIRCHRSFIVNIKHVESFSPRHIFMKNHKIPVSKTYYQEVKEKIKREI